MTTEMWIIAAVRVAGALPVLRWPLAGAFIAIFVDLSDLFLRDWLHLGGLKDYQEFDKWLDQAYMLTFLVVALRWQAVPRDIAVALYGYRLAGFAAFEISGDRDLLLLFPNVFEYWFIFVAALKTFGWEELPASRSPDQSDFVGSGSLPANQVRPRNAPQPEFRLTPEPQLSLTAAQGTGVQPPTANPLPLASWPLLGPFIRFAIPYRYSTPQLTVALAVCLHAKLFHEYTLHVGQWFEGFTATEALEAIWRFLTPPY